MNKGINKGNTGNTGKEWPTLCRVLFFCMLCAVALAASSGVLKNLKGPWAQITIVLIAAIFSLLLTKLFAGWERLSLNDIGFASAGNKFSGFIIGLAGGALLAFLQSMLVLASGHIRLETVPGVSFSSILAYFILYLAIGVREEIAFRGFPIFSLQRKLGPLRALLIVAIIFIVEHKIGGTDWLPAIFGSGTGSVLFGLAAIKTRGLALPIGLHSAWNFGQWSMGFKNESGILQVVIEKGYERSVEIMGWVSYLLVMSLAIAVLYYFRNNRN